MPVTTSSFGIHQSDLIIRSALLRGLQNMRAKPWLLDYCFASLPQDELTAKEYGQKTVDQAKDWFLQQNIAVFMNTRIDPSKYPAISITLQVSAEDDATLGDVHYEPREDSNIQWPTLYGPFVASGYDPVTGLLTLPTDVATKVVLFPGMIVIDDTGDMHQVIEAPEDNQVVIAKGLTTSMQRAVIKAAPPALTASMESVLCRETYSLGVHVGGDPEKLIWLHSVLVFILLAYKEMLLEARGYERSSISSSDMGQNQNLSDEKELVYSRYITITGFVRQQWPKSIKQKITSTVPGLTASEINVSDGVVVDLFTNPASELPVVARSAAGEPTVYWGAAASSSLDSAFVQALSNSSTSTFRQRLLMFNVPDGEYAWYAFPSAFGGTPANFVDADTGFESGFSKINTVVVGSTIYAVWRSNQPGLGTYEVEVQ